MVVSASAALARARALCACRGAGLDGAARPDISLGLAAQLLPPSVSRAPLPLPFSADSSFLGLWENSGGRYGDRIWL